VTEGRVAVLRANLPLLIAAAFTVTAVVFAVYERGRVTRLNCQQIEALKAEFREQALERYQNLDRDGRLLGIEITPELREQAARSRNKTLARFAAREC
jgi:hypothetical protein